jgi:alpha-L-arabinofuranosidase
VDGFNRWSFTNRGDLDGQWQLVRTWDIGSNKLLEEFTPQPNAYYQYGMLTRYFPKHSSVLATTVDAPFGQKDRKLVATALRTPKGNMTVVVVNEGQHSAAVNIDFDGLAKPVRLERYSLTKEAEDKVNVEVRPERSFEVSKTLADHIPPMSIVVYSTYLLKSEDPGVISE